MPLSQGKSKKAFSHNVKKLIDEYKTKGRVGKSKPVDLEAARKQALAIAFSTQGGGK